MISLAALIAIIVATPAGAQERPLTLDCTLEPKHIARIEGHMVSSPERDQKTMSLTFTGINIKASQAMVVGSQGAEPVSLSEYDGALTFREVTTVGNTATTTIVWPEGGGIYATHTRHMFAGGIGLLSLYHGPCRIRTH